MIETNTEISDKDFLKYATVEDLKVKLEELRRLDLSNASQQEIMNIFFSYFDMLPSLIGHYSAERFNDFFFYRARLDVQPEKEDLNLIQTYSYPPPQFCRENGRANLKSKSVFYCSNCALTAILESKPETGNIGYLSVWSGNTSKQMKAGILLPTYLKRENVWHGLSDDIHAYMDKLLSEKARSKASFFQEGIKFIAELFLTEKAPYSLTSWISNELIYGSAWKDFIIYPSFVNDSFSCNLAFHPNAVDRFLKFEKVIRFKIQEIRDGRYSISTGRVGEIVNTNIQWRAAAKEELDFALFPYTVTERESNTEHASS